ncbi:MAG: hypothetical protein ACK5Q5_23800 [Planctomycetaceae bacterium]
MCVEHHCYCRKLDDCHTAFAARRCAYGSLPAREGCDYRRGYTQAFVDVALGRTGEAPPVPPQRYWSVCFRSSCGDDRANDWYAGYRDGASQAIAQCGGQCNQIPSSGTAYVRGPVRNESGGAECSFGHGEWNSMTGCPCGR